MASVNAGRHAADYQQGRDVRPVSRMGRATRRGSQRREMGWPPPSGSESHTDRKETASKASLVADPADALWEHRQHVVVLHCGTRSTSPRRDTP